MYPRAATFVRGVPMCNKCRYFKSGRCKLFMQITPDGLNTSMLVEHARGDSLLCGTQGLYFSLESHDKTIQKRPDYYQYEE